MTVEGKYLDFVKEFAADEASFHCQFSTAFLKVTELGMQPGALHAVGDNDGQQLLEACAPKAATDAPTPAAAPTTAPTPETEGDCQAFSASTPCCYTPWNGEVCVTEKKSRPACEADGAEGLTGVWCPSPDSGNVATSAAAGGGAVTVQPTETTGGKEVITDQSGSGTGETRPAGHNEDIPESRTNVPTDGSDQPANNVHTDGSASGSGIAYIDSSAAVYKCGGAMVLIASLFLYLIA
jgi:hypothetical protein